MASHVDCIDSSNNTIVVENGILSEVSLTSDSGFGFVLSFVVVHVMSLVGNSKRKSSLFFFSHRLPGMHPERISLRV